MSRLPFSSIRKVGVIMSDTECKNKVQAGKSPLEQGKKTIFDLYEEHKKLLDTLSFISSANINYNAEDYNLPNQNKFMHQAWNKTFLISKKKGKLNIKLVGNFIVSLVKECTYIFNDKSGKKPLKHYIITLQNHNGKIEKDVEITGNSKTDFKQFQTSINNQLNDFVVNMNEAEFKAFVAEYISPKVASNVIIYKNAGVTPSGNLLYANALATPKGIKRADEDGYIEIGENSYIKLAEAEHYQPKLAKSLKPGKQIANALITNIIECKKEYEDKYSKKIPVIVAGGIFDKQDIIHAINLGADGVQIASRFVATKECDASPAYKQAYINARQEDVQIIQSPVGMPGRALRNAFIKQLDNSRIPISKCYNCLVFIRIGECLTNLNWMLCKICVYILLHCFLCCNLFNLAHTIQQLRNDIRIPFHHLVFGFQTFQYGTFCNGGIPFRNCSISLFGTYNELNLSLICNHIWADQP